MPSYPSARSVCLVPLLVCGPRRKKNPSRALAAASTRLPREHASTTARRKRGERTPMDMSSLHAIEPRWLWAPFGANAQRAIPNMRGYSPAWKVWKPTSRSSMQRAGGFRLSREPQKKEDPCPHRRIGRTANAALRGNCRPVRMRRTVRRQALRSTGKLREKKPVCACVGEIGACESPGRRRRHIGTLARSWQQGF